MSSSRDLIRSRQKVPCRLDTLELYDIQNDPSELNNLAPKRPEIVEELLAEYEDWFSDVTRERDFHSPQRIHVGQGALNSYKIVYSPLQLSGSPWFDRAPIRAQILAR